MTNETTFNVGDKVSIKGTPGHHGEITYVGYGRIAVSMFDADDRFLGVDHIPAHKLELMTTETPAAPVEEAANELIPARIDKVVVQRDGTIDLLHGSLIARVITKRDDVNLYNAHIKALESWSREYQAYGSVYTRIAPQPAQPLDELETLRAENAALKADIQEQSILIDGMKEITAGLRRGMKEKDTAFNELMAERNQLRDALETTARHWQRVERCQTTPTLELVNLVRQSEAIIRHALSTLESE